MKIKPSKKLEKLMREVRAGNEPRAAAALFGAARKLPAVRLKKILVTTDFSDLSMAGVRAAVSLAHKLGAAVSLVHVVKPSPHFTGTEATLLVRNDLEVLELAERDLSRIARTQSKNNLVVKSFVRYGQPFNEIAKLARTNKVDLIVSATHGHTGFKRLVLGSTAERVVRHAPCPVLTIPSRSLGRRRGKTRTFAVRRIVVPIDFSETSILALPYAAALAEWFGAEIILLHVIEPLPLPADSGYVPADLQIADEDIAKNHLLRLCHEVFKNTVPARAIVRTGQPFDEITLTAASLGAEMIVLTTHGHTGLTHVLLGSTAERVVRHADCPVLVVR